MNSATMWSPFRVVNRRPIDIDGSFGLLETVGQGDAEAGVLGFAQLPCLAMAARHRAPGRQGLRVEHSCSDACPVDCYGQGGFGLNRRIAQKSLAAFAGPSHGEAECTNPGHVFYSIGG